MVERAGPGPLTWAGLGVVAASAAVLSFAAVRDLAAAASYPPGLAWLLPVVIDTTAVMSSRIWLGAPAQPGAVRYARALALSGAAVTITANITQHALAAYQLTAPWWLIAALAAVPPAALVAVAHLVALLTRTPPLPPGRPDAPAGPVDHHPEHRDYMVGLADQPADGDLLTHLDDAAGAESGVRPVEEPGPPRWCDHAPPAEHTNTAGHTGTGGDRAVELIAAGAGRRRLARELGMSEHEARQLLTRSRPTTTHPITTRSAATDLTGAQATNPTGDLS